MDLPESKRVVTEVFFFEQTADPFGTDSSSLNLLDFLRIRGVENGNRVNDCCFRYGEAVTSPEECGLQAKSVRS